MAFSESDRVKIRRYLGFSAITLDTDLENAITNAQSTGDGGAMPDDSTETDLKAQLAELGAIEARISTLLEDAEAHRVDSITVDNARSIAVQRQEGRRRVRYLSAALETPPRRDVFS